MITKTVGWEYSWERKNSLKMSQAWVTRYKLFGITLFKIVQDKPNN